MKSSLMCPKCQSRKLWVIEKVRQVYQASEFHMRVNVLEVSNWVRGTTLEAGHFEAWVCAACGFTEWYARDANDGLAKMAAQKDSPVRLVDTTGQRGPFR